MSACDETRGMKRGEVCMRAMERRWGRGGGGVNAAVSAVGWRRVRVRISQSARRARMVTIRGNGRGRTMGMPPVCHDFLFRKPAGLRRTGSRLVNIRLRPQTPLH